MKRLILIGAVGLGVLVSAGAADAQAGWGCAAGPAASCSPGFAPWQCPPTRCWTPRTRYNPCQPYSYSRSWEPCCEVVAPTSSDGLRAEVIQLRDEVIKLKDRVKRLEEKSPQ